MECFTVFDNTRIWIQLACKENSKEQYKIKIYYDRR